MVGVGDGGGDDTPGLIPAQTVFVHHYAHELGDDEGGVSVVYLDNVVLGEGADIAVALHVLSDDALCGRGHEEILLLQAQGLALDVVVGGIEHLGDDLGHGALLKALDVLALGEQVHIQGCGAAGVPEAQDVYLVSAVAGDEHIARHRGDGLIADVLGVVMAEAVPVRGDVAAEADLDRLVVSGDEPAFRRAAPVVGYLGLLSVGYLLAEDAQLVADGIARRGDTQRGKGIHVAGGEAAQTAVAESGVVFRLENIGGIAPQILERAGERLGYAEVKCVFHETAAHEKLHGKIVNLAPGLFRVLGGEKPAHYLAYDYRGGLKDLVVACVFACNGEVGAELILDGAADLVA